MSAGDRTATTASRGARSVGTLLTVGLGMAVAVQARINGELGRRLDDGVIAALLSFLGGLALLVVLAAIWPEMRRGLARVGAALRDRPSHRGPPSPGESRQPPSYRLRPYHLSAGLVGAFVVTTQGITVATIGVAVFTVALVAGQVVSSLLVDRAGAGPGGPQAITMPRLVGSVIALAAVVLAVSDRLGTTANLWPALLPALAGLGIAWQQAAIGRVGAAARCDGSPLTGMLPAALINFIAGTSALLLVVAVEVAIRGLPEPLPAQPWLYLGGPLGVLIIGSAAVIVPVTGVLLLGVAAMTGQLIGALLLDLLLPAGEAHLTVTALAGTVLTLLAVSVIALTGHRQKSSRSP